MALLVLLIKRFSLGSISQTATFWEHTLLISQDPGSAPDEGKNEETLRPFNAVTCRALIDSISCPHWLDVVSLNKFKIRDQSERLRSPSDLGITHGCVFKEFWVVTSLYHLPTLDQSIKTSASTQDNGSTWSSSPLLSGFVLGSPEFSSSTALCNSQLVSLPLKLGFLMVYVLFEIFSYLFTVSPISTTVLNTYDT